jgi:hypothetical protein
MRVICANDATAGIRLPRLGVVLLSSGQPAADCGKRVKVSLSAIRPTPLKRTGQATIDMQEGACDELRALRGKKDRGSSNVLRLTKMASPSDPQRFRWCRSLARLFEQPGNWDSQRIGETQADIALTYAVDPTTIGRLHDRSGILLTFPHETALGGAGDRSRNRDFSAH